jgi:hypothetical protein
VKVRVIRMRQGGVPIGRKRVNHDPGVVGELFVEEHIDKDCGRTLRVARLASTGPLDSSLLPQLVDVQLLWVGNQGFVLSGVEQLNEAAYAQSWWCRTC